MFRKLFKPKDPEDLNDNLFRLMNKEWMLITAGDLPNFNTMTASWGTTGILWNRPVAICFIRPQRYTFEFVDSHEIFTLSFLREENKDVLNFCGTHSGRNVNKIEKTGLIPIETPDGGISFQQSKLIIECKKLYADFLKEEKFILESIPGQHYPKKDYHKFFIGEILSCYVNQ